MELLVVALILGILALPLVVMRLVIRVRSLFADLDDLRSRVDRLDDALRNRVDRLEQEAGRSTAPLPSSGSAAPVERPSAPGIAPIESLFQARTAALPPQPDPAVPLPSVPPPIAPPAVPVARPVPTSPALPKASPGTPPPFRLPPAVPISSGSSTPAQPAGPTLPAFDWEQFMGVKLFAWVGGFALFLAVAFFVKYSFENNLIPAELRVAMGFLTGLGLVVGGVMLKRKDYEVTAQTLCATGVVILYAVTFACHAYYHFTGSGLTFLLMCLVTATAFLLAVRMSAMVVAILGLLGGFLTPPLLSTGVDNPLGLFGYLAILNVGLIAVALRKRWHFLVAMGVAGTILTQIVWAAKFFAVEKVFVALAIFATFNVLFAAAFVIAERLKQPNPWFSAAAVATPAVTFAFSLWLLGFEAIGESPGLIYCHLLLADLTLLALVGWRHSLHQAHVFGGAAAFLVLAVWTASRLSPALMNWALAGYFGFALLHTVFPVLLQRIRPQTAQIWWGHLFPVFALLLTLIPFFKAIETGWGIWLAVLLVDVLAVGLAAITGAIVGVLAAVVLTMLVACVWILQTPVAALGLAPVLVVVGGFAALFLGVGLLAGGPWWKRWQTALGGGEFASPMPEFLKLPGASQYSQAVVPAVSAILPFLLLVLVTQRLPLANPSPVYGLAWLLLCMLLALVRLLRVDLLAPVGLVCVLALEYAWHGRHFVPEAPGIPLLWHLIFVALFLGFPFAFRHRFTDRVLPWATAALAGPLHFHLIYQVVRLGYPNEFMGLLPAALAIPMVAGLAVLVKTMPVNAATRNSLLAWFGGSALFFITLIFPVQFDRQWITVGWALEGAALLWLFHRIPHPGLRGLGFVLLVIAFARLALNPEVFGYQMRSPIPIWNWYLYTYGLVTGCLMVGARLLAPPRDRVFNLPAPAVLYSLGTVLAFFLLNIEIADYFTAEGNRLRFEFSGDFARDMTYSIAWALFALALLGVGVWKQAAPARYAAIALLGITVLKLFLHDLVQLDKLYRAGAFLGVAIISILASVLYQRFFAAARRAVEAQGPTDPK